MIRPRVVHFEVTGDTSSQAAAIEGRRPNIVLFLVDDMDWMDCGAYGSKYYKTRNIDAFARQSMRFTDAHSMPSGHQSQLK